MISRLVVICAIVSIVLMSTTAFSASTRVYIASPAKEGAEAVCHVATDDADRDELPVHHWSTLTAVA